jgi:hypothetical protein
MTRSWLAAAALAVAACSELPAVERGVCGNRVVEPGEECDGAGPGGTCAESGVNACFFVCDPAAPLPGCPEGRACGVDQRCRLPGGGFADSLADTPTFRFDVEDFRVGDVDGDSVGDVMGGNPRAIRVRFGGAGGNLGNDLDVATRRPTGPFEFTRFDDNPTMDAVVPVGVGVFSLVAEGADLVPVAYSSIPFSTEQRLRLAAVEVVTDIDSEILLIDDRTMAFLGSTAPRTALPASFTSADIAGEPAIADLHALRNGTAPGSPDACAGNADLDRASEVGLAFLGADRVYVASASGCDQVLVQANNLAIDAIREVVVPAGTRIGPGGAFFGRFNADECVDLLISTVGPCIAGACDQLALASGVPIGSQCSGTLAPARTIFVASGGRVFEPFQPIAAGDFDGEGESDGIDDLVLTDRVVRTRCGGCASQGAMYDFGFLALATAPWGGALVTDINRDGNLDVAARVDGADDVDLLLGTRVGAFNRYQIDTAAPVVAMASGDFDGDLFLDLAIAERGAATDGGDVLSVAFGSPAGGPSPPVVMSAFSEIVLIAPVSSVGDVESIDLATDLIVVSDRTGELGASRAAAILLGDTSRRMVAPFLLRAPGDRVPDVPRTTVAGLLDAETGLDLAVVAEPGAVLDGSADVPRTPRLWILRGDASGEIVQARSFDLGAGGPPIGEFAPLDALYAVGELDGELPNEIVGIDRTAAAHPGPGQISRLLVARAAANVSTQVADLTALGGVRAVRLADLDADGDVDLYASFGTVEEVRGDAGAVPPSVLVIWNQGGALDAAGAAAVTVADATCRDLAPLQADGDPPLELVLLCVEDRRSFLAIADLDSAGVYAVRPGRIALGPSADNVETGDVDGDHLDDILVHRVDDDSLRVIRQCAVGEGCLSEGASP